MDVAPSFLRHSYCYCATGWFSRAAKSLYSHRSSFSDLDFYHVSSYWFHSSSIDFQHTHYSMGCWQPQNISNFQNLWCFDLQIPRWLNWFLECSAFHNSRYQMRRCHWAIRNCSSTGAIDRLWRSFLFLLLCLSNCLMDQIVRHHNGFLEVWCPCGLATFCCLGGVR